MKQLRQQSVPLALAAILLATGCAGGTTGASYAPGAALTSQNAVKNAAAARLAASNSIVLQTLDVPISQFPTVTDTTLTGIRGSIVTSTYIEESGATGAAVYNLSTGRWIGLQYPNAASTAVYGPDVTSTSYRFVGSYKTAGSKYDHGMLYDAATNVYTTLDAPASFCAPKSCNNTIGHSIYGDKTFKTVGNTNAVGGTPTDDFKTYPVSGHAYLYDSATKKFTLIDIPGAISSTAYGIWIDGSTVAVAGGYADSKGTHGYVRNLGGKQLISYSYPGALVTHFEGITGAGGAGNYNICGDYTDLKNKNLEYGFYIPVRNWKFGTPTVIGKVSANTISEKTVLGIYVADGITNGFITDI